MMRHSSPPVRFARTGCSVIALATVLVAGSSPAVAQSLLGTGTPRNGSATTITTGPGTTTILVSTPQTVIDWVPTDNATNAGAPINFQNSGTTASFLGTGNYAVLNNIAVSDMSRVISMNGAITAGSRGNAVGTGSIYFYSPSGFLLGGNSVINVGSLVLSASPIFVDANGGFINGAAQQVVFGQALRPTASITTNAGSQINASAGDAYVAMVAPRVQHGGSINVNGSAALVGAEAATINFSPDGLFDIQVTSGTTDANGVSVNGDITGSASTGAADARRAFLVAIPKNSLVTLAISSGADLGFTIAAAADVVGNAVILSAGHDIVDGEIGSVSSAAGALADINANGMNATSGVRATATNFAQFHASAGQAISFASDLSISAPGHVWVNATGAGARLTVGRDLTMNSDRIATTAGASATGGFSALYAQSGGLLTVNRNVMLTANGVGAASSTAGVAGGTGTGGSAWIQAEVGRGTINIGGNASAIANGVGGAGLVAGATGGLGAGGNSSIRSYVGTGSVLTIGGTGSAQANGTGGSALDCTACVGGGGNGGTATVLADFGGTVSVAGALDINADGLGGNGATGRGGNISLSAIAGSTINIAAVRLSSQGTGGDSSNNRGGDGFGGSNAQFYADGIGSRVTVTGTASINADAAGGDSDSLAGGNASGGNVNLYAQNGGNVDLATTVTASSDSTAGIGGSVGGTAFNTGDVNIFSFSTLHIAGLLYAHANSTGGDIIDNDFQGLVAGNATGGRVNIYAQNGTLNLDGPVIMTSDATGGGASGFNDRAGSGTGGESRLFANVNGTVNLGSTLYNTSIGRGGRLDSIGPLGGNGQGGAVRVQATAANAHITIVGDALVDASGNASNGGECFSCDNRGNGTGGTAWVDSFGASTASLNFQSDLGVFSRGSGGGTLDVVAGIGRGGEALLQASAGSRVSVVGDVIVNTDAFGGISNASADGVGGLGAGGTSRIQTFTGTGTGGLISIGGSASISAEGIGGRSNSTTGGRGGDGVGGTAQLYATPGVITIGNAQTSGGATLSVNGYGGNSVGGTAGDGFGGGIADLAATNGGSLTIAGFTSVSADGSGGDGLVGGDGDGGGEFDPIASTWSGGASIYARNGTIVLSGGARVSADGAGGDAIGLNSIRLRDGGAGGSGFGGLATIFAANSDSGPSSIRIVGGSAEGSGIASVHASGSGGRGGDGASGGDGGNGGNGTGGSGGVSAAAGNGTVTIDEVQTVVRGGGGDGGTGGSSTSGTGGDGGSGGIGDGGDSTVGTVSGAQATASNLGFGDYGSIRMDVSATGGSGGNGGNGTTAGNGGNGGAARGGGANLLVRGSRVDVDVVTLIANATGGDGGRGDGETSGDGNGGNATVGTSAGVGFITGIDVLVSGRFQIPTQRGVLNAGTITGTAIATGGNGLVDGTGLSLSAGSVRFLNADGNIGSLDFTVRADGLAPGALEDAISVINGRVIVNRGFTFTTATGNLSLFADNGSLTADTITLNAANFVADRVNVTPVVPGTYFARLFDITTRNNFLTTANLDSVAALRIIAPGSIFARDVTGDASILLNAQNGLINVRDLDAGTSIVTNSAGNTTTGNAIARTTIFERANGAIAGANYQAGGYIDVRSVGGIALGNLIAGDYIDLRATGAISLGNAIAGQTINLLSGTSISGGNLTAGDQVLGETTGTIQLGNVEAGLTARSTATGAQYAARFSAGGAINTGNVSALGRIGFGTPTTLNTGNLSSGAGLMALVGGNAIFGSINASYVYIGNYSMSPLGGLFPSFDRTAILALPPVATGGSILINGPVTTSRFEVAAGTTLTSGAINSSSLIYATSGNMTLGNLSASDDVRLTSGGNIATGSIRSDDDVALTAAGSISTGDIVAVDDISASAGAGIAARNITGNSIDLSAGGAIATGNLRTQNLPPDIQTQLAPGASISVQSRGDFTAGSVNSIDSVYLSADGSIATGAIDATRFVLAQANSNIATGSITTASNGRVYLGGQRAGALLNPTGVLAQAPVATNGSITVGGTVSTSRFQAAAGNDLTTQAITAGTIEASAGGNATVDGLWRSPSVSLRSGNIAITANGSIDAGTTGSILLNAVNASGPALIGDGLTGSGYALSNAEFSRLHGGLIRIAIGGNGGSSDARVGDLAITGAAAGNNIQNNAGGVEFVTLQSNGTPGAGTVRVVGNVAATGFSADNYLGFYTQNFELDAATGSIALTGSGASLAGVLELYATRIHVAETNLLNQLAANPQFSGYREALNRPAATQRPGGVIRAASFDIEFGGVGNSGPYSLLVQNMGTVSVPAGFLLSAADIGDDGESQLGAGSLDLAINGQIQTPSGTLTGVAVRDFLVNEFGTTPFVPGSTINGCPLTGSCNVNPIRVDTLARTDVQLTDNGGLGDGLFGNEGDIDDGEDGDGSDRSSPIAAPDPLFDSRPLNGGGDIDDPVSGAGNPSLMGTSDDDDECDVTKDATCKVTKKGDGK